MNRRIEALCSLIEQGSILADIGTDHALLPIRAVLDGRAVRAYACDVRQGPLHQAEANIAEAGLSEKITVILSDGFDLVPDDCTDAVIAGMGYYTAAGILDRAAERLMRLRTVIVQINAEVPLLRQWVSDHHFTIDRELTLYDRGHYYTALRIRMIPHEAYSAHEILCGVSEAIADMDVHLAMARHTLRKLEGILPYRTEDDPLVKEADAWRQFIRSNEKDR